MSPAGGPHSSVSPRELGKARLSRRWGIGTGPGLSYTLLACDLGELELLALMGMDS